MINADFQDSDILPPAPEVIVIDDDDDTPFLPALKHKSTPVKLKPDVIVPPISILPEPRHYPARTRTPPTHLGLDNYHLFAMVAEDTRTSYPYVNAKGQEVDLAIQDEVMMAHICQYVMLHAAESQLVGNPNNKKQYGLKMGLRKFQQQGNTAVMKELTQFHTMKVFCPMDPKCLTREDRWKALTSLVFLTKKQTAEVKAGQCAKNGSVQHDHIANEEAMAPTVITEAIFIQGMVSSMKGAMLPLATFLVPFFKQTIQILSS